MQLIDEANGIKFVEGPVATIRWAMSKVGWKLEEGNVWKRLNGDELDVTFASLAYVKKLVMQDWETTQWNEAKDHRCYEFDQWTTCQVSRSF
jgi:hypothetical protein